MQTRQQHQTALTMGEHWYKFITATLRHEVCAVLVKVYTHGTFDGHDVLSHYENVKSFEKEFLYAYPPDIEEVPPGCKRADYRAMYFMSQYVMRIACAGAYTYRLSLQVQVNDSDVSGDVEALLAARPDLKCVCSTDESAGAESGLLNKRLLCNFTKLVRHAKGRFNPRTEKGLMQDACNMLMGQCIAFPLHIKRNGSIARSAGMWSGSTASVTIRAQNAILDMVTAVTRKSRVNRKRKVKNVTAGEEASMSSMVANISISIMAQLARTAYMAHMAQAARDARVDQMIQNAREMGRKEHDGQSPKQVSDDEESSDQSGHHATKRMRAEEEGDEDESKEEEEDDEEDLEEDLSVLGVYYNDVMTKFTAAETLLQMRDQQDDL